MWSEEQIKGYLKNNLKEKRYEHVLSVEDMAIKLAEIHKGDVKNAKIAALVHDCAKNMSDEQLIKMAEEHNLCIDEICRQSPQLLHAPVAAIIGKETMGIEDVDILNAVTYHTTGRKHMSLLEKIIYIADYVEPLRKFSGVDDLRSEAYKDVDIALLKSFNNTIKFVIDKGQLLHLDTIEGRNEILKKYIIKPAQNEKI
jgi:predicted HD superfamily hydrolase involved in NAD metabolism